VKAVPDKLCLTRPTFVIVYLTTLSLKAKLSLFLNNLHYAMKTYRGAEV
jgi:hypothetical protein